MTDRVLLAARSFLQHKARLPVVGRGGKNLNWRFESYTRLLKTLGHADGMAESIEVAIRDFIVAAIASGNPQAYLRERAHIMALSSWNWTLRTIALQAA